MKVCQTNKNQDKGKPPPGRIPKIGDIYMMRFDGEGNEQKGWRPGVVYQNNLGNKYSPNLIVLPLTSALKKTEQPTHVVLPASIGLVRDSMVLCENPERMSKERLGKYITSVPAELMSKIAVANLLATSAIAYIDPGLLHHIWEKASAMNIIFADDVLVTST